MYCAAVRGCVGAPVRAKGWPRVPALRPARQLWSTERLPRLASPRLASPRLASPRLAYEPARGSTGLTRPVCFQVGVRCQPQTTAATLSTPCGYGPELVRASRTRSPLTIKKNNEKRKTTKTRCSLFLLKKEAQQGTL